MTLGTSIVIDTEGLIFDDRGWARLEECLKFLEEVEDVERRNRLHRTLQRSFEALGRMQARVTSDFAPLSFGFSTSLFVGGVIFHGPTNGSAPNFSVHLDATFEGWSVHT